MCVQYGTKVRTVLFFLTYDADLLNFRAENATFNGVLIGSVVMTEILVWSFDAVSGPGTVPGPETASNDQTCISVLAQSSTETPPDSLLDKL